MGKKLSIEEFKRRAVLKHGNRYDYSNFKYLGYHIKGEVICSKHGSFLVTAANHLKKCGPTGCPKCDNSFKKDIHYLKKQGSLLHNNKYNYSNFLYVTTHTPGYVTCAIHGDFLVRPSAHLRSRNPSGCPKCSGNKKLTTKEFKDRAISVHGYMYDYSKVAYINSKTKVIIICEEHGEFEQSYEHHVLRGQGCPNCKKSFGEIRIENFLQNVSVLYKAQHKFKGCNLQRPLLFDFYIPSINTIIEYDGLQHFQVSNFSSNRITNLRNFVKIIQRDIIKDEFCRKNNIRLLRISYEDYDNIDYILEELFVRVS